jgi:hypothetical protein
MRVAFTSVTRSFRLFLSIPLIVATAASNALAAGADYDGNGFSEIPVLSTDSGGTYAWTLFDPFSGKSSVFTQKFGSSSDRIILANWIYPKITSAGIVSAPNAKSGGRLVWTIRTAVRNSRRTKSRRGSFSVRQQQKYLGRPGDTLLTGGDFDGDKVADAVVVTNRGTGRHTWGLRGSFFLAAYNPTLNVNRAYFGFGDINADKPFFLNPDGKSDWFAVTRRVDGQTQQITLTQPFTKALRAFVAAGVPDAENIPVPVGQDDGSDLLVFFGSRGDQTELDVRDLSGDRIATVTLPIRGEVTVGNYGPGPGEEIAVSSDDGTFLIYNPITGRLLSLQGPAGFAVDSINLNTLG